LRKIPQAIEGGALVGLVFLVGFLIQAVALGLGEIFFPLLAALALAYVWRLSLVEDLTLAITGGILGGFFQWLWLVIFNYDQGAFLGGFGAGTILQNVFFIFALSLAGALIALLFTKRRRR